MRKYKTVIRLIGTILFILYISYLIYLTFFDHTYGRNVFQRRINLVPFKTIVKFLTSSYDWKIVMINIAGNIAAFVPMGFLPPIAFSRMKSFSKVFAVVLLATLSIEIFQYIFAVGTCDIDDVILNVLGGVAGYFSIICAMALISKKNNNIKSL